MISDVLEKALKVTVDLSSFQSDRHFKAAADVLFRLQRAGFHSFFVGGAVRDIMIGRRPKDWDVLTTAHPDTVAELFPGSDLVGAGFGVTIVKTDTGSVEVATARRERFYMDGRHPEKVEYTVDVSIDVLRRDFTINALLLDPGSSCVYDFTGGIADISKGIIRTIGEAETRFREDYLRMLRCIRFAARFDFAIEADTFAAIRELSPLTGQLAPERIRCELDMMLTGNNSGKAFRLLEKSGLLHILLPEVAILRNFAQPPEYHPEGDVLEHTLLMLDHIVSPSAVLAWGVLFHDLGKAATFSLTENGRIHFFEHEKAGLPIAEKIMERLRFSRADIKDIIYLVANHMRFGTVKAEAKLRRYEGHGLFAECLELNRLDAISGNKIFTQYILYLDRMIAREGENALPAPFITGDDLIAAGYIPEKSFGRVLAKTYDAQLEGILSDKKTALAYAEKLLVR